MTVAAVLGVLAWSLQPSAETAGATPTAEPAVDMEDRADESLGTIVLLAVDGPEAAERAEAISAHVHGLVELVTSDARPAGDDPQQWYELAVREAERRAAIAAVWVEAEDEAHYVLSVVRPGRREIRWRRIAVDPSSPSAAIEALGVVTRSTTSALVAGTALQMETTSIPEPTPRRPEAGAAPPAAVGPAAPRRERERGRAMLAAGYAGTSYAKQVPWQSGIGLEAGWAWPFGLQVVAGYAIYQRVRAQSAVGTIEVSRHPIVAMVGYHRRFGTLGIGGDGGLVLDYARRRASAEQRGFEAGSDRGRVTTALTARARASVVAVWRLEVFAAIGIEVWLSQVRYGVETGAGEVDVVLMPRRARATVGAGLAVRL